MHFVRLFDKIILGFSSFYKKIKSGKPEKINFLTPRHYKYDKKS